MITRGACTFRCGQDHCKATPRMWRNAACLGSLLALPQTHVQHLLAARAHQGFGGKGHVLLQTPLFLVAFSGLRGLKMILSFVFAFLAIWKLLIPSVLKGFNPLLMCTSVLILLILVTLPMVSGINKRSLAAILGSVSAMLITVLVSVFMTWYLRIHGSVLEMSESLLYSGFMDLDLTSLFSGVVCLSAGGAIMDLSIDVSAAMWEVREHAPDTSAKELFRSAMEVGKAGVGTQITTLLLAYMGSYLTLMMVYMAQATPVWNIFTSKSIAAEILQTLAGSFGIVLVTPLTALIGTMLFKRNKRIN